jgi:hypothetical protein
VAAFLYAEPQVAGGSADRQIHLTILIQDAPIDALMFVKGLADVFDGGSSGV